MHPDAARRAWMPAWSTCSITMDSCRHLHFAEFMSMMPVPSSGPESGWHGRPQNEQATRT
jgi:hypothetical protein